MRHRLWLTAVGLLTACASRTPSERLTPDDDAALVCVPSSPTVSPLDTVTMTVLPYDSSASYTWTVSGGRLLDQHAAPRWTLRDAGLGFHDANVTATWRDGRRQECTVRVRLIPPGGTMGGGLPARAFLTRQTPERQGYGLYSYLLLGSSPNSALLPRYRRAMEEYVRLLPAITAYGDTNNPAAFNINYLPVNSVPPSDHADSVLANYDYSRAQALLAALPGSHLKGPYLVSVRQPLSGRSQRARDYLFQDLSAVPDTLVGIWVREFLGQATQETIGARHSLRSFALRLRTLIGVLSLGLPDVAQSMGDWKEKWKAWVVAES